MLGPLQFVNLLCNRLLTRPQLILHLLLLRLQHRLVLALVFFFSHRSRILGIVDLALLVEQVHFHFLGRLDLQPLAALRADCCNLSLELLQLIKLDARLFRHLIHVLLVSELLFEHLKVLLLLRDIVLVL